MSCFVDMSCQSCGRRFGYQGSPGLPPPCPHCGFQIDMKAFQEIERRIKKSKGWRATPHAFDPNPVTHGKFCRKCGLKPEHGPHNVAQEKNS